MHELVEKNWGVGGNGSPTLSGLRNWGRLAMLNVVSITKPVINSATLFRVVIKGQRIRNGLSPTKSSFLVCIFLPLPNDSSFFIIGGMKSFISLPPLSTRNTTDSKNTAQLSYGCTCGLLLCSINSNQLHVCLDFMDQLKSVHCISLSLNNPIQPLLE